MTYCLIIIICIYCMIHEPLYEPWAFVLAISLTLAKKTLEPPEIFNDGIFLALR